EALAEFNLEVHHLLHLRGLRIANDRATAQCARAKLHPALEPANDLLVFDQVGNFFGNLLFAEFDKGRLLLRQKPANLLWRKCWPQVRAVLRILAPVRPALLAKILVPAKQGSAQGATGISRRRLNPNIIEDSLAQDAAVCDAVKRNATCQA